jgi:hypothetical protein
MSLWRVRHTLLALPQLALDTLAKALKVCACHADIVSFLSPGVYQCLVATLLMVSGHVRLFDRWRKISAPTGRKK